MLRGPVCAGSVGERVEEIVFPAPSYYGESHKVGDALPTGFASSTRKAQQCWTSDEYGVAIATLKW